MSRSCSLHRISGFAKFSSIIFPFHPILVGSCLQSKKFSGFDEKNDLLSYFMDLLLCQSLKSFLPVPRCKNLENSANSSQN